MAKIYLIVNRKNNKKYVGQTIGLVTIRFCQHIDAAYRKSSEKRKNDFYKDIKASGENVLKDFDCQILEECEDENKFQREVFYIQKIKPEYNENFKSEYIKSISDTIIEEYRKGNNITEIRKKYRCRHQLISPIINKALKEGKIKKHNSCYNNKRVYLFDINGKVLQEWYNSSACSLELNIDRSNIRVCALNNSKENMLYFHAEGKIFKYDNQTPKDMYEVQNKKTGETFKFKSKEALLEYFNNFFPEKKLQLHQIVRNRKSVYGFIVKKLYNRRY